MKKEVPIAECVGLTLAHDITEIRPGEYKGPAFRKGHKVRPEDIDHLRRIGKSHLYVLEPDPDELHEDDAVAVLAHSLCGENVGWDGEPNEGKLKLIALEKGLLKINTSALFAFNMVDDVMCATRHTNTVVQKGQEVAGTRAIPLLISQSNVDKAARAAREAGGVISVKCLERRKVGVVITGNEVYNGLIQDKFEPVIRKKVDALGLKG